MRKGESLKVFAQIRDLEIFDRDGELCGICDELELSGGPGEPLRIAALLVGPGAYGPRLPRWAAALVRRIAGERVARVPWDAVAHVTSRITLDRTAEEAGLGTIERRLAPLIARLPFA
jgi:hypothetical protein